MQDIENKKTILDDDASIYQKREERDENKSVRRKWSELDCKGKWYFFRDYYLLKLLLVLFFGGIAVSLLYTTFKHKPEQLSYIAIIDSKLDSDAVANYFNNAVTAMGFDKKDYEIVCNNSFSSLSSSDGMTLSTYIFAGDLDIIIAPAEALKSYYESGTILALDLWLPSDIQEALSEDDYFYAIAPGDNQQHSFGILLNDTAFVRETNLYNHDVTYYLCVVTSGENIDNGNVFRMIRHLLELPQPTTTPSP